MSIDTGAKMAQPPQKEIPGEMNALEKEITGLENSIEELVLSVVVATSQEEAPTNKGQDVKSHSCELAAALNTAVERVRYSSNRIQSLTNRIQL